MKTYWYPLKYNVGDTLTPFLLEYFLPGVKIERVEHTEEGKFMGVGSIMKKIRRHDIVWGSGVMRSTDVFPSTIMQSCKFLAVRGPLTAKILRKCGATVPEVYGDPALLLPLMYPVENKSVKKLYKVGVVPHYSDKKFGYKKPDDALEINVALPWQEFVDQLLLCERIVSSSLHGIVMAEAYGVPASWTEFSDRVIGKGFKFQDYLTGTGRAPVAKPVSGPVDLPPIEPEILAKIQKDLITTLHSLSTVLPH